MAVTTDVTVKFETPTLCDLGSIADHTFKKDKKDKGGKGSGLS